MASDRWIPVSVEPLFVIDNEEIMKQIELEKNGEIQSTIFTTSEAAKLKQRKEEKRPPSEVTVTDASVTDAPSIAAVDVAHTNESSSRPVKNQRFRLPTLPKEQSTKETIILPSESEKKRESSEKNGKTDFLKDYNGVIKKVVVVNNYY